jgi:large subunit ribosomal protein L21
MYAVVELGGKQYCIKQGDVFDVEKEDVKEGKEMSLKKVLLVSDGSQTKIGQPYLKDALVKAEVISQVKGEKKISYKYRRRKSSDWKKGHRQQLTRLKIKEISFG